MSSKNTLSNSMNRLLSSRSSLGFSSYRHLWLKQALIRRNFHSLSPRMDSERLVLSAPNSRSLHYSSERSLTTATSKAMSYEPTQKTSPPILERFRALLKQRDDELRALAGNNGSPPLSEEIVQLYDLLLSELSFNSKPIITDLTIIAGDQRQHGKGIADVICARILEVPADQKLPSLYLLDSIVKNIGREYIRCFSSCLPEVFCEAYRKIHPNQRNAMRHLFGTWSTVFPPSVLCKIEDQLQFSPITNQQSSRLTPLRASESPRPSHGIHVNPKYLHQLERGAADSNIQQAKGISSVKVYGQKPVTEYVRYNTDRAESARSKVGAEMLSSGGSLDHISSTFEGNKVNSSSNFRRAKLSSPSRLEADRSQPSIVEELKANNSRSLLVERASPSHRVFDYGTGIRFGKDEETSGRRKKKYPDDNQNQVEPVTGHRLTNGHEEARALIDAYGSDGGKRPLHDNSLPVEHLETNGLRPISWQNTEEEEFDWEDMSPTLANSGRNNDTGAKAVQTFGYRTGIGLDGLSTGSVKTDTKISWSSHGRLPAGYSIIADDAVSSASPWNVHNHISQPSQHLIKSKGAGRNFQKTAEKISQIPEKLSTGNALHRHPAILSRTVSSSVENYNDEAQLAIQPKKLDILGKQEPKLTMLPQHGEPIRMHHGNHMQSIAYKPMFRSPLEVRDNFQSSPAAPLLAHLMAPSLSQGFFSQVPGHPISSGPSISQSAVQLNLPINNIPSNPSQLPRRPPLPPGPHPGSMHLMPMSSTGGQVASGQQSGSGLSSLMNSLVSQGLISLTNQNSVQDSVGLDFNLDVLKLHHKSAISALYTDLPRQCTTCGLRFKSQEEHSSHMDWHVTKNRMSKSRKQNPSRKWFVNVNMWLSGAEALGTEAVPGFLPAETVVEKDSDELAVPADEDQNACALCGEPFDDFYSDEFEEWMYKGAVYMNAPDGLIAAGMDKTQLGSIVHAKCRSDSSSAPPEYLGQDEGGLSGEGNQRKRPRS